VERVGLVVENAGKCIECEMILATARILWSSIFDLLHVNSM